MNIRKKGVSCLAGLLAAVLALSLLAGSLPVPARALSSGEIKDQINNLEEERDALDAQMAELDAQMTENMEEIQEIADQKKRIDQQIFLLYEQVNNINEQIAAYGVLIADKQEELDEATARFDALSDKNRERVRAMEEEGELSYWSVLFKASSFADLLDRINMINEIAAADKRRLEELADAAQVMRRAREDLETQKAGLEANKADLEATQLQLDGKRAEADRLLAELHARGEEYEEMMRSAEEYQLQILEEIALKEDEYDEAVYNEWMATYVPPAGGNDEAPPVIENDGNWYNPLSYIHVSSPFGMRIHPIWGDWRMHQGVDLGIAQGSPIYAVRGGQVISASYDSSMGYYVYINHGDGYRTISMHMTHYVVSPGEMVAAGQIIGYVGSTGDSTGPHLHLGLIYNGIYVNPMWYLPG